MIKLFHTADLHFGVENYGRVIPQTGIHSRLWDFKLAFERCVDQAIEQKIDCFVMAGDAYKTAYPSPTQQKLLMEQFFRLHAARIPIVMVVGNHDHPLSFGKANALDVCSYVPLDGFYLFSKPGICIVPTNNGPLQIVGIPWPTRNHVVAREQHHVKDQRDIAGYLSEQISSIITSLAEKLDSTIPAVLVGHLTVSNGVFSGSEKCAVYGTDPIFMPSQLAIKPFDYVALGHLHRYQNVNKNDKIPVVYSGSIERVDFGERKEEKGYCRVSIGVGNWEERVTEHAFVPLTTRSMLQIEVVLDAGKNQTDQIVDTIKKYDIRGAIVKILYHLPEGAQDKVDLSVIQRFCSAAHFLVGVMPIHKVAPRQRRAELKVDMDLETLLRTYFRTKPAFAEQCDDLVRKGLALAEMLDNPHDGNL